MIIQFNEIPKEGQNYDLNEHTRELADVLKDLIGETPFKVELEVLPLGQSFEAKGVVETKLAQVCSLCADEFTLELKEKFHQIVMDEDTNKVSGFESNWSASDVEVWVNKVPGELDVGQMVHEVVALAQPLRPVCKEDCKGLCLTCGEDLNHATCNCAERQKTEISAFSVLKKLKLN
jgi:uncharacterized protein